MYGSFISAQANLLSMKRVRLTLRPGDTTIHPVYDLITGGADYLSTVEVINWNVAHTPVGILHRIEGNRAAFAADLNEIPQVVDYDITSIDEDSFYIYLRDTTTPTASQLFETFSRGSFIMVQPIEFNQDGTVTITGIGPASVLQAAIDGIPDGIEVDIEEIGGPEVSRDTVTARLSDRQHAAIVAGINAGYYEIPRQATHSDVAATMECASSTASEHLRKAESKLITALFT